MASSVPQSFVDHGQKLRVLIINGQNRGMPRKLTHRSKTEIFLGVVPTGKVIAPGILMICPVDKKRNSKKKLLLAPIGASMVNAFNSKKGVLLVPGYEGTKGFTHSPQKMDLLPKNGQI